MVPGEDNKMEQSFNALKQSKNPVEKNLPQTIQNKTRIE
jgi:hypothetical protein